MSFRNFFVLAAFAACALLCCHSVLASTTGPFALDLPVGAVPDRLSITESIKAGQTVVTPDFDGPGCIRHILLTLKRPGRVAMVTRKIIMRIYFDGSKTPNVEGPVGDFFGVMHGVDYYDINTQFLSVQQLSGYNCYFEMPFAKSARIEFENGPEDNAIYLQVDWQRYPGKEMRESRRFCAQWRREMPAQRYGRDYLMLDADGPGNLIGFVYGVRLLDDTDRWSHGGASNMYIDGHGDQPAYIRGIGGEDEFGTSYGGVIHPPETHLYASMPYNVLEDTGEARGAQRVVGYRFFPLEGISFNDSIQIRFGSMANDICSMVYWYQNGSPRRFARMPDWDGLLPGTELPASAVDLPLPDSGAWLIGPMLENKGDAAVKRMLGASLAGPDAPEKKNWIAENAAHGFVDFNHVFRPHRHGVGMHYEGVAGLAASTLEVTAGTEAHLTVAWDDRLILRVNDDKPIDLGVHTFFRPQSLTVPLRKGSNHIMLFLTNEKGTNHGGWAFDFQARTAEGALLTPRPAPERAPSHN